MKLLILSDLHVDLSPFVPDPVATAAADVVVLAGDIHIGSQAARWARKTFVDKPVVLVAGNHELYDGHWERTLDDIREVALREQVHFLENDAVVIGGVQFLGATLWTDFAYFGADTMPRAMAEAQRYMADYMCIRGCTPEATLERHRASRAWLEAELAKPGAPQYRVVVSHHSPRKASTPQKFQNDLVAAAFGSELPADLLDQAGLWVHGHTHSSFQHDVGRCRVVCNPRGYRLSLLIAEYENPEFNPRLLVEQIADGRWVPCDMSDGEPTTLAEEQP